MPLNTPPYDEGYSQCECFWGRTPATLVTTASALLQGMILQPTALDAGCGDGKNAAYLANSNFRVTAVDISHLAITRARNAWPEAPVEWIHADVRSQQFADSSFHLVVSTGMIHCLNSRAELFSVLTRLQHVTRPGGYNVLSTFNDRTHDLTAHPGFTPCLVSHSDLIETYADWDVISSSDETLQDMHPHNGIRHHHSVTRLLARKPE